MAQIFSRRATTIVRAGLLAMALGIVGAGWVAYAVFWSPYTTQVRVPREQPVPFSHKHHVAGLGIDCRYCHTGVEKSAFAGIPPTETCMTCHSQLWTQAALLEPVRRSLATGVPIRWNRVNDLPDFVYFNHSIHVAKGIGCATCHGQVDQMPLTWKEETLYMRWCLDCHRDPAHYMRPRAEVFNMAWKKPPYQEQLGRALVREYHVQAGRLQECSVCHR